MPFVETGIHLSNSFGSWVRYVLWYKGKNVDYKSLLTRARPGLLLQHLICSEKSPHLRSFIPTVPAVPAVPAVAPTTDLEKTYSRLTRRTIPRPVLLIGVRVTVLLRNTTWETMVDIGQFPS